MVRPNPYSIEIANESSSLDAVVAMADQFIAVHEIDVKTGNRLQLCLDELIANILYYGFSDGSKGTIRVDLGRNGAEITVSVSDTGKPFNPFEAMPELDLDADLDEREIGGLGIFFVTSTSKQQAYERAGDWNLVTFRLDIGAD